MSESLVCAFLSTALFLGAVGCTRAQTYETPSVWTIDAPQEWKQARAEDTGLALNRGRVELDSTHGHFASVVRTFHQKRTPKRIVFEQTDRWTTWEPVTGVEPNGGADAPVLVVAGEDDYWYLNARKSGGVYGAWHSTDMEEWTPYEGVLGVDWVTTVEYADGQFYVYYDEPNDEDPHLIVDDDLTEEGQRRLGRVFDDPSNGSDAGVFRAGDGSFHLIYEDWSPINARQHSWDSPLAGHAESPDGIRGFAPHEHPAPIDERAVPTPHFGTYRHPNGEYTYHRHQGPQDAYGDYTMIRVGSTYYLFCDYHPHDGSIRLGYWMSDSLEAPFRWGGTIGEGTFHPDPTVGFAEGQFYLFVRREKDFVSSGPWVGRVSARVGVDRDGDQQVDQWTRWQPVQEKYARKPGFSRIVDTTPAHIDLSFLPAGRGFAFQFRMEAPGKGALPVMDRVSLSFEGL